MEYKPRSTAKDDRKVADGSPPPSATGRSSILKNSKFKQLLIEVFRDCSEGVRAEVEDERKSGAGTICPRRFSAFEQKSTLCLADPSKVRTSP